MPANESPVVESHPIPYYVKLRRELEYLFGEHVQVGQDRISVGRRTYPVVDDVIVLTEFDPNERDKNRVIESFGREWAAFSDCKAEHIGEFENYFDLVNLESLHGKKCADFGCGMGRWSQILLERVEVDFLVVVDLSEAIDVARRNLRKHDNVIFLKADLEALSFRPDVIDFSFCLGVLHHIPGGIDKAARNIAACSKQHLCYLYYDLDNRGLAFRTIFRLANGLRCLLSSIERETARTILSHLLTIFVYYPFILLASLTRLIAGSGVGMPLEYYIGYGYGRVRQDAYDRFFTPVEHRFDRRRITEIFQNLYAEVMISKEPPYWHFLCRK